MVDSVGDVLTEDDAILHNSETVEPVASSELLEHCGRDTEVKDELCKVGNDVSSLGQVGFVGIQLVMRSI